jgi:hypothetical protein
MKPDLPGEAHELAASATRAFEALGGIDAARRAEVDPATRADPAQTLKTLGADDLDPRDSSVAACAAAALCEAAGRVALPHPVEAMLLAGGARPFAVVAPQLPRTDHGDLYPLWDVATLDGGSSTATCTSAALSTRLGPFACDLTLERPFEPVLPTAGSDSTRVQWWLVLTSWRILGALEQAVDLAVGHTNARVQFGKALTAFQTVRFTLADAAVAVAGLRELALYTLWRLHAAPSLSFADCLALRCHALDTARGMLRATQQLHGASGLCDEYDISILVRHLQPALRLPEDADATAERLAEEIRTSGFEGLFPHTIGGA